MKNPALNRHTFTESRGVGATLMPLSHAAAVAGIAHQAALAVPAKFILTTEGQAGIQAELPRVLETVECRKLAGEALDAALAWVDSVSMGGTPPIAGSSRAASDDGGEGSQELESALDQLPWSWRQIEADHYQVYASPAPGIALRVSVSWCDRVGLRVSSETRLRATAPIARQAMGHFALEANPRLRLARASVEDVDEGGARIVWDAVLPSAAPLQLGIAPMAEAVVHAQALTRRAFAALEDERVARTYLRLRGRDAVDQGEAGHSRATERLPDSDPESISVAHETVRQPVGLEA